MFDTAKFDSLKEINAYKKKLNWGETPAIYHMASTSISELDGILTHGFESAYKTILNPNSWNLDYLGAYKDEEGNTQVRNKPKVILRHYYDEQNYELHCYPVIRGEMVTTRYHDIESCPFHNWTPETLKRLFRISSLVSFIIYTFQSGDRADLALIHYSHKKVQELIHILDASFDIVKIKGYNIAEFCNEIYQRQPNVHLDGLLDDSND